MRCKGSRDQSSSQLGGSCLRPGGHTQEAAKPLTPLETMAILYPHLLFASPQACLKSTTNSPTMYPSSSSSHCSVTADPQLLPEGSPLSFLKVGSQGPFSSPAAPCGGTCRGAACSVARREPKPLPRAPAHHLLLHN